ncbi:hypothetical protein B0T22DRAFT_469498 [Podospora appendiculata]|uniref:Uncharacterized protein n=1 Tax=Podospora appendiculata TaxID=314037 RepID=A0AAE0X3E5_9PEZI|nr:hypothetical protein B0T22DRAFT_469498 [Podospora appendiculata]
MALAASRRLVPTARIRSIIIGGVSLACMNTSLWSAVAATQFSVNAWEVRDAAIDEREMLTFRWNRLRIWAGLYENTGTPCLGFASAFFVIKLAV